MNSYHLLSTFFFGVKLVCVILKLFNFIPVESAVIGKGYDPVAVVMELLNHKA